MTENDQMKLYEARNGFTGKTLTNAQFDDAWAIGEIMLRSIEKNGSFIEKLADYSHAFARSEKFDQMRAETILRDIFRDRYGRTMNQMREELKERGDNLPEGARSIALGEARRIEHMISRGETRPFYRAFDSAAHMIADQLNITESRAKELMKSVYQDVEGRDLYETGKAWEKQYHEPVREAARQEHEAGRSRGRARDRA